MKLLTKSRLNHFRNQFVSELLKKNIYIAVIGQSLVHLDHAMTSISYGCKFSFMQRTEREDLQTEYVSSLYMSG